MLGAASGVAAQQWGAAKVVTDHATIQPLAPSVELPGTVVSRYDSRLASELSAKLVWIAEVGTEIEEGDTVASLEDLTFKISEMEAESLVEREQARVTFLESELQRLDSEERSSDCTSAIGLCADCHACNQNPSALSWRGNRTLAQYR
jgi:multidrug efflux pump subunit AcrA (membrane-fusion protein)